MVRQTSNGGWHSIKKSASFYFPWLPCRVKGFPPVRRSEGKAGLSVLSFAHVNETLNYVYIFTANKLFVINGGQTGSNCAASLSHRLRHTRIIFALGRALLLLQMVMTWTFFFSSLRYGTLPLSWLELISMADKFFMEIFIALIDKKIIGEIFN